MVKLFDSIKSKFRSSPAGEEAEEEYLELDTDAKERELKSKIVVKTFSIEDFSDIKPILDALREGYTIAIVNIKPIRDKDLIELKRSINKIKKTCDAVGGDIAGVSDDIIVATPGFASIYRTKPKQKQLDVEEQ